jgi:cytochrome c553
MSRNRVVYPAAAAAALLAVLPIARADPTIMELGEHLAQECTSCHRKDGTEKGIPPIVGWAVPEFVTTMRFYKTGERTNPAMVSVAKSLDDDQLTALAVYWGSLKRPGRK